jgi:UDP:flavonoid glycosyltransferase YjiC (YdhE family)
VRILFTFAGGAGHLTPLLPLAAAARERGHDVALAGKPSVVALAEGYTTFGTGVEHDAARAERAPLAPVDRRHEERVLRSGFAGEIARRRAAELTDVAERWPPDVFVCDETDFGGTTTAEELGLPHATMLVNASGSFVVPEVLDGVFDVALLARHLVLNPFPRSFRAVPLPPATVDVRLSEPRPHQPADRPRVYFSLGTIFDLESGDLFERVIAALGRLRVAAVATVGRRLDPTALGSVPPNVLVAGFVAQDELLPSCDLVVCHGGSGSLLGAFSHGLPVVVLPLGADQPWNADRCEATGVGVVLDAASSADAIAGAIEHALATRSYRDVAESFARELGTYSTPAQAVEALEQLAF